MKLAHRFVNSFNCCDTLEEAKEVSNCFLHNVKAKYDTTINLKGRHGQITFVAMTDGSNIILSELFSPQALDLEEVQDLRIFMELLRNCKLTEVMQEMVDGFHEEYGETVSLELK